MRQRVSGLHDLPTSVCGEVWRAMFYLRRWAELWCLFSAAVTLTVGFVPGDFQWSRNSRIAGPGLRYAIEITESIVSNLCEYFVGLTTLLYWNTADQTNRCSPQLHWLNLFFFFLVCLLKLFKQLDVSEAVSFPSSGNEAPNLVDILDRAVLSHWVDLRGPPG